MMARTKRAGIAALLMMTSALTGVAAMPATAQPAGAQAAQRDFDIPAQSLTTALVAFGQQSGLQVTVDGGMVRNLTTRGVRGRATSEQALQSLLAGTGLTFQTVGGTTVTLQKLPSPSGVTQLDPVRVEGQQASDVQSPFGPGDGYVATRSATATKTDASILETPGSVSVVTRQQMDDQAAQSVTQALRYAVGVDTGSRGMSLTYSDKILATRGFRLDQYLDGLKLLAGEFGEPQIDPYFLDRIEVLHGPASVLYGQANPGGVAMLVSKRPTDRPVRDFELRMGSYGFAQAAFDVGGAIDAQGKYLYRLTGLGMKSDSQIAHVEQKRFTVAPAFTWRPDNDTSLTILTNYQRDPQGGFFAYIPAAGSALPNPYGKISTGFFPGEPSFSSFNRTQYALGYLFDHRFNDAWTVRQNLRYGHVDVQQQGLWVSGLAPDMRTLNRYAYGDIEHNTSFTVDSQAEYRVATGPVRHTVLAGVDYYSYRWDQKSSFGFGGIPSIDIFNPVYGYRIPTPAVGYSALSKIDQVGLYAQDQMRFGNFVLLLGGRQDWAGGNYKDRLAGSTVKQSDGKFTGRAGLVYVSDSGVAPYASYATSFNPVSAESSGTDFSGQPFKPTTAEQYEVGVKYQPPGRESFVTLAAYQLTQQNVTTSDPAHPGFSIQTGEVRSRGIELAGVANLTREFKVTASYSYTDNVVTKGTDSNNLFGIDVGKRPPNVPANMASAWGDYTFQSGPMSGFGVGGGVRYVGSRQGNYTNTFNVSGYTLADAVIHYDLSGLNQNLAGWKVAVNAQNLFDKDYVAYCYTVNFCSYGQRRTVYGTLKYSW